MEPLWHLGHMREDSRVVKAARSALRCSALLYNESPLREMLPVVMMLLLDDDERASGGCYAPERELGRREEMPRKVAPFLSATVLRKRRGERERYFEVAGAGLPEA